MIMSHWRQRPNNTRHIRGVDLPLVGGGNSPYIPALLHSFPPDMNPVDNSMWEMLQEYVYKKHHCSGAINDATHWRTCIWLPQWPHSPALGLTGPLCYQSLFQFVQITEAYFVHLLLQLPSHAVIDWIQIWRIWRPQLRWDKFSSFFLCKNTRVARVRWAFKFHKVV